MTSGVGIGDKAWTLQEHHSYEEERAKRKAGLSTGAELAATREGLWPLSATHDRDRSRERPRFRIF